MYTYNKDDKSYTFSSDDLDIDAIINSSDEPDNNNKTDNDTDEPDIVTDKGDSSDTSTESNSPSLYEKPKKIEVITGGNDLNISPVSDYLEVEKPKNEKKENIVIPQEKK